jgi:hypothetical protein
MVIGYHSPAVVVYHGNHIVWFAANTGLHKLWLAATVAL